MTWRPIDFEGIISVDKPLYDQLNQFLFEKEGALGECIVQAIHVVDEKSQISAKALLRLKLSEALENFEKRIRQVALSKENLPTSKDFEITLSLINNGLWQYVETLESCVIELFRQIDQLSLEKWHKEMSSVVNSIKILLMHRMEDVAWAIRRMENLLKQYRKTCVNKRVDLKRWLPGFYFLDHDILKNLEKSKKYLTLRHKKFAESMLDYNKFQDRIDQNLDKFQSFVVYKSLDSYEQEDFKRIYKLLKLDELNQTAQKLPSQDIVNALLHIQSEEKIYQIFNRYYQALKEGLFHHARLFKLGPKGLWKDSNKKALALEVLSNHRKEIHALGDTVIKYRDLLLRRDPNLRSVFSFRKKLFKESAQSKRLFILIQDIQNLDGLSEKLRYSFEKGPSEIEETQLSQAAHKIEHWLHESYQPLASRALMHTNIGNIINQLADLNELGSFDHNILNFFSYALSKTLRVDWKYNVAFELPKFQEVYHIHQGLLGRSEDRQHFNRLKTFKHIIQQIQDWAKKKITQRHFHEIDQDLSDIKLQLQDFLAYVQRQELPPKLSQGYQEIGELRQEISRQLLEYRYQFGQFFHHLSVIQPKDYSLLNQFLFVYQYFEAVENKLNDQG